MSQKLFVLGATGRTGQQVVAQALAAATASPCWRVSLRQCLTTHASL